MSSNQKMTESASGIFLDAKAATAFAPSTASVMINVTQVQLILLDKAKTNT
jgi:hypothetical protein